MPKTSSAEAARLAQAAAIAEAAYYRAEHRNFEPGSEVDDWLEAEREILGAGAAKKQTSPKPRKKVDKAGTRKKEAASGKPKAPKAKGAKTKEPKKKSAAKSGE